MDLNAYFERIGYRGPREPNLELLGALTRQHTQSIPY
jgi:arylamine N-acetyltransferase